MDAAAIVKRVRALRGITRKELAELANLSPSTVGRIERGEVDPTWGTLSRILSATGYQISGGTIVSAGDISALAAARPWISAILDALEESTRAYSPTLVSSTQEIAAAAARSNVKLNWPELWGSVLKNLTVSLSPFPNMTNEWWEHWQRAGWLKDGADTDDLVALAVSAGNAAKISRRSGIQRAVDAPGGWQSLARALSDADVNYAASGLVATRNDRSVANANLPVFYVEDPVDLGSRFSLSPAALGRGVLLIEASDGELDDVEAEEGIWFVPRSQAILDALAGSGREPDKAENELRKLLAAA
ncbi:transcriptional regulator with XRE-family HTH domain [Leucobacter exalbidus]|uniref:Transcriptional regulator with XRE-family HTH domain n=1 Tax=Leucobacter exalbidus TaxID=662960 RepID=A0A940T370_9MICO|nr:helix-turn-helix transcriptional regulator [Leucobacter exalbidus]MBP1325847.1 transcriptional regulator with XRE-family HTH domain [Leucobacter exalbidus]